MYLYFIYNSLPLPILKLNNLNQNELKNNIFIFGLLKVIREHWKIRAFIL